MGKSVKKPAEKENQMLPLRNFTADKLDREVLKLEKLMKSTQSSIDNNALELENKKKALEEYTKQMERYKFLQAQLIQVNY